MEHSLLLTRAQVAELLQLSTRSVDYLIQTGKLPSRKIGKARRVPREAVEKFASRDHPARITPQPGKGDGR